MSVRSSDVGLVLAVALAAGAFWQQWQNRVLPVPPPLPQTGPGPVAASLDTAFALVGPYGQYQEAELRPLFNESRRPSADPPPAAATPVAAPPVDPGRWRLTGVLVTPDGRAALLLETATGTLSRVPQGGLIDGWTIDILAPERVRLQRAADAFELTLLRESARPSAPGMPDPRPRKPPPPPVPPRK